MKVKLVDPRATYLVYYPWLDPKTVKPFVEPEIVTHDFVKLNSSRSSKALTKILKQRPKNPNCQEYKAIRLMTKYHFMWNDNFKSYMNTQRTRFITNPFETMFDLLDNQGWNSIFDMEQAYQLLRPIIDIETKNVGCQQQMPVPEESNHVMKPIYQSLLSQKRYDDLLKVIMLTNGYYVHQIVLSLSDDIIKRFKENNTWTRIKHMSLCDKLQIQWLDTDKVSETELQSELLHHEILYLEDTQLKPKSISETSNIPKNSNKSRKALRRKRRLSKTKKVDERYCNIVKRTLVKYKIGDDYEEVEPGTEREKSILMGISQTSSEESS